MECIKQVSLRVRTRPEACRIHLDGEYLGESPIFIWRVPMGPGEHVIHAEQTFFEPSKKTISISADQTEVECDLVLEHVPGFDSYQDGNLLRKNDDLQIYEVVGHAFWLVGPDRDLTFKEATEWISSLGHGWTMPERKDLVSLRRSDIGWRSWGPFQNGGWWVWASDDEDLDRATCVPFLNGLSTWLGSKKNSNMTRAFAIRRTEDATADLPDRTPHQSATHLRSTEQGVGRDSDATDNAGIT